MLSVHHSQLPGEVYLLIKTDLAQAWISYYPPAYLPRDGPDWRLRVRLSPHEPVLSRKTPTGLLVESYLRTWLLQRFRRRLTDLRFAELREIAEHKLVSRKNARLMERKRKLRIL
jgi:hypothetical protein